MADRRLEVEGCDPAGAEEHVEAAIVLERAQCDGPAAEGAPDAEDAALPVGAAAVLPAEIPYSSMLKSPATDRVASNPISVPAMMRLGGRASKEALTSAAAMILRRAGS